MLEPTLRLDDLGDILTTEQLEKVLGVSRPTVFDLAKDGKIRSLKVGRRRMFPKTAVREFIESAKAGM